MNTGVDITDPDVRYAVRTMRRILQHDGFSLDELKTGTAFCKLLLMFAPLCIPPPYDADGMYIDELKRQYNIRQFYLGSERIGFPAMDFFPPICFEQFNPQKGATCIVEMVIFAVKNGWISTAEIALPKRMNREDIPKIKKGPQPIDLFHLSISSHTSVNNATNQSSSNGSNVQPNSSLNQPLSQPNSPLNQPLNQPNLVSFNKPNVPLNQPNNLNQPPIPMRKTAPSRMPPPRSVPSSPVTQNSNNSPESLSSYSSQSRLPPPTPNAFRLSKPPSRKPNIRKVTDIPVYSSIEQSEPTTKDDASSKPNTPSSDQFSLPQGQPSPKPRVRIPPPAMPNQEERKVPPSTSVPSRPPMAIEPKMPLRQTIASSTAESSMNEKKFNSSVIKSSESSEKPKSIPKLNIPSVPDDETLPLNKRFCDIWAKNKLNELQNAGEITQEMRKIAEDFFREISEGLERIIANGFGFLFAFVFFVDVLIEFLKNKLSANVFVANLDKITYPFKEKLDLSQELSLDKKFNFTFNLTNIREIDNYCENIFRNHNKKSLPTLSLDSAFYFDRVGLVLRLVSSGIETISTNLKEDKSDETTIKVTKFKKEFTKRIQKTDFNSDLINQRIENLENEMKEKAKKVLNEKLTVEKKSTKAKEGEDFGNEGLIYENNDGKETLKWFMPEYLSRAAFNEDYDFQCAYFVYHRLFTKALTVLQEMFYIFDEQFNNAMNDDEAYSRLHTFIRSLIYWVSRMPEDFKDQDVNSVLRQFIQKYSSSFCEVRFLERVLDDYLTRELHFTVIKPIEIISDHASLQPFDKLKAKAIARQMTLIESNIFQRVNPQELIGCAWSKVKDAEKRKEFAILEMTARFNLVVSWVTTTIVEESNLAKRAARVLKFMKIAVELYNLRNFNGVYELCAGVNSSSVKRLKKTLDQVRSKDSKGVYEKYQEAIQITKTDNSNTEFREALNKAKNKPCVPYLGVFLQDLTFIDDGNKTQHPTNTQYYNFNKFKMSYKTIRQLLDCQQFVYGIVPNNDIMNFLNNINGKTEDECYSLSLKCEARSK